MKRPPSPERVAIVGLGPSLATYVDLTRRLGGRHALADETWVVNALGDVIEHDRVWHMDDVRVQEVRAAATPASNIAVMLRWLKAHPGPIYTSRLHPEYPGLVELPIEAMLNDLDGMAYFNSTVAWAVAYAIFIKVKSIFLFGIDFTYPNSQDAEKGRACVEFWLGVAMARGIETAVAETSSLTDMCVGRPLYGFGKFGSRDLAIRQTPSGRLRVRLTERPLATAAEIEREYDHSLPTSPHVAAARKT